MMKVKSIKNLDPFYVVKWRLTDACNYSCRYCIRRGFILQKEQEWDWQDALQHVNRILATLPQDKPRKVDLIGGEVTLLPYLPQLMQELACDRINITSNFSKGVGYWQDLLKPFQGYDKEITATFSYHSSQTDDSPAEFVAKVAQIKPLLTYVKIETVRNSRSEVRALVEACTANGIDYMVEGDLLTAMNEQMKDVHKPEKPRYEVTFEDGHTELFYTRNAFLKQCGEQGSYVNTEGYLCTKDYDMVYIERDTAITCRAKVPLAQYTLYEQPHTCFKRHHRCTLCGNLSLLEDTNA